MPAEKMEMKMSCVCLVLGLVLLMTVSSDADSAVFGHPDNCCFSFVTFKIPDTDILKVEKTHPTCPKQGYMITTPRGRFCTKDLQFSTGQERPRPPVASRAATPRACPVGHPDPDQCCFNFVTFTIPEKEIIKTVRTPPGCPEQGYVITTRKAKFCKRSLPSSTKPKATVPPMTFRVTTPRARAITRPDQCCLNFVTFKIPEKEIIKVEKTPSDCPKQGYRVTTARGKYCTEEDVLASTTQQQSTEPAVTFRLTTARGKLDKEEDILVSTTQHQSTVPSVYFIVTTAKDKLNNEEDVLVPTTQQQSTVPTVTFRVTTAGGKLDSEEDVLVPTTQQQSTVPTVTFRVTTAGGKLDSEEDVLMPTIQMQSTVPTVTFRVTTTKGKLDSEEDVLMPTTQQQSSVSTGSSSVTAAMSEFCLP